MNTAQTTEQTEIIDRLKEDLNEGDTIFVINRKESRTLAGSYSFFHLPIRSYAGAPQRQVTPYWLTYNMCLLLGYKRADVCGKDAIRLEDFSDVTRAVRRLGEVLYNNPQAFEAREI